MKLSKELKVIKPVSSKLYARIKKYKTMTGSKVFGGYSKNSDIDLIINPKAKIKFDTLIENGYGYYEDLDYNHRYFTSVYVKSPTNKTLNLLLMSDQSSYKAYVKATKIMKRLVKIPYFELKFKDKSTRISMFEFFLHLEGLVVDKPQQYSTIPIKELGVNSYPSIYDEDVPF